MDKSLSNAVSENRNKRKLELVLETAGGRQLTVDDEHLKAARQLLAEKEDPVGKENEAPAGKKMKGNADNGAAPVTSATMQMMAGGGDGPSVTPNHSLVSFEVNVATAENNEYYDDEDQEEEWEASFLDDADFDVEAITTTAATQKSDYFPDDNAVNESK